MSAQCCVPRPDSIADLGALYTWHRQLKMMCSSFNEKLTPKELEWLHKIILSQTDLFDDIVRGALPQAAEHQSKPDLAAH